MRLPQIRVSTAPTCRGEAGPGTSEGVETP